MKTTLEKPFLPILFIALLAAHIVLVWLLPYFPTQDGPSHIYNLSILKDLRSGGELWGGIYYQQLSLIPNLGFHIIAYPLLYFFDPLVVEKLFISAYLLLLITSVACLLRLLDKPVFPWAFLVFPAALSYSLAMGFYSYVIALPLVLLGGGICWRLRKRGLVRQCGVITICAMIIYCFHLIAFAFFVILVAIQQFFTRPDSIVGKLFKTTLVMLPSGLILLAYIISNAKEPQFPATPFWERIPVILADLVSFGSVYFSQLQSINGGMIALAFYLLFRFQGSRELSDPDKVFCAFCAMLLLIDLCAPPSFGGGGFFNERIPQVIMLGLIPILAVRQQSDKNRQWMKYALPGLAVACFIVNVITYSTKSSLVEDFMDLQKTPVINKSAILSYRLPGTERSRADVLMHAVSYYALKHTLINAGNYEADLSYFTVKFRPEIRETLPESYLVNYSPQKINFANYPVIRYILSMGAENTEHLRSHYSPVKSNGSLILWERNSESIEPELQKN